MNNLLGRASAFISAQASRFARDDEGATAVEYGLIIALVGAVIVAGALALGGALNGAFNGVANVVTSHVPAGS